MTRTGSIIVMFALAAVSATPAWAQTPQATPPAAARPLDRSSLRNDIYVMEGALSRAVSSGAQRLNREVRSVMPEMMALSGEPQARGVYLEGYGVFFDVGVPILHQSMMWSFRQMLGQDPRGVIDALNTLKQMAKSTTGAQRAAVESAITRLELQIGPVVDPSDNGFSPMGRRGSPSVGVSVEGQTQSRAPDAVAPAPPGAPLIQGNLLDKKYLQDPNAINRAYTEFVQSALIDAMITFSLPMAIGPDEFLTVAARDNMQRDTLAPADPYEEVVTVLLRIKGSDLAAYRTQQIDRDEARKRVQVREF